MNRQELSSILKEHRNKNGVLIKRICAQMDAGANIINRLERALFNYNCNTWLSYMNAIGTIAQLSFGKKVVHINSTDDIVGFIKTLRNENEMSQREFGSKCNISHITVANIERGQTRVTIDVFLAIINAFGYELQILDKVITNNKTQ